MSAQIIRSTASWQDWLQTPPGQYLLAWECAQFDRVVADLFGYHALQLGWPALDGLRANRIQHRWLAQDSQASLDGAGRATRMALVTDFGALPFAEHSLDLVLLPHTLELSADPHATLREVYRVLVPEGRVVVCGFNPMSLWGLREHRAKLYQRLGAGTPYLPGLSELIGPRRLRDWLRLLSFEVESSQFGCWRPAVRTQAWLQRFEWMDGLGERWWPIFGAVYFTVAVKRVRGMKLLGQVWSHPRATPTAPVTVTNSTHRSPLDKALNLKPKLARHERD